MAGYKTDRDRNVIPRWRRFEDSLRLGELDSSSEPPVHQTIARDFLSQKIADWRTHGTVGHAADLVGAAITLRREDEVSDAASFLLRQDHSVSEPARSLARRALMSRDGAPTLLLPPTESDQVAVRAQVRTYRQLLREEPYDAISWVELARQYAALGLARPATQAMDIAVQLAPNNRFVLRSASRLWIHTGEKDKAYDTLYGAERTRYDPWLLSAEIAVGSIAGRKLKRVRRAKHMLRDRQHPAAYLSELASAVATLELGSGGTRQSKKLFRQSLEEPTENSVAQAVWADSKYHLLNLQLVHLEHLTAYEAESRTYYNDAQWNKSVNRCELWQFDQPFSASPGWHGTFTAAVAMSDYEKGATLANRSLVANPEDFTLRNNLAFCLINQGELDRAETELERIDGRRLEPHHGAVLAATYGLLSYRRGNTEQGRLFYEQARHVARREGRGSLLALATAFHAIEEMSIGPTAGEALRAEALELVKGKDDAVFSGAGAETRGSEAG